jgi:hypothetical protein
MANWLDSASLVSSLCSLHFCALCCNHTFFVNIQNVEWIAKQAARICMPEYICLLLSDSVLLGIPAAKMKDLAKKLSFAHQGHCPVMVHAHVSLQKGSAPTVAFAQIPHVPRMASALCTAVVSPDAPGVQQIFGHDASVVADVCEDRCGSAQSKQASATCCKAYCSQLLKI